MDITHKFDEVVQARYELDLVVLQTFDELERRIACMEVKKTVPEEIFDEATRASAGRIEFLESEIARLEKRITMLQQEVRQQSFTKRDI